MDWLKFVKIKTPTKLVKDDKSYDCLSFFFLKQKKNMWFMAVSGL